MSNMEKKVDLDFVSDKQVLHKPIRIDTQCNPIAFRTRSHMSYAPTTESKCKTPTSSKRKSTLAKVQSSRSIQFQDENATPRRSRVSRKLYDESDDRTPRKISKLESPACEKKVTPLKISAKSLRSYSPLDDSSASEDLTPKIQDKQNYAKKLDFSEEDVFRPCSRRKLTPRKKVAATSTNGCRTPRTPRTPRHSDIPLEVDTAKTGSLNKLKGNSLISSDTPPPRRSLFSNDDLPKTPYLTRNRTKKAIQSLKYSDKEFEETYSEESDYSEEEDLSCSEEEITPKKNKFNKSIKRLSSSTYKTTPQSKTSYQNLVRIDSEKYFDKKSEKNVISNHALSELPIPKVSKFDLNRIASIGDYVKHQDETNQLLERHKKQFNKWLLYLREGFNLVLYGLGSKRKILQSFHSEKLNTSYVLTVNGFDPACTIKKLFEVLLQDILQVSSCPSNINDALSVAVEELKQTDLPVFIIIHNIDGVALRGTKQQAVLSELAESPYVHILASVDHINAPLLWGNDKMSRFNFLWLDVTTFHPYSFEISFQNLLEIENLGSDSSLTLLEGVLKYGQITPQANYIFKTILKDYLINKNKKDYKGVLCSDLLTSVRDKMIITTLNAINLHLREFIQQNIIQIKNNYVQFSETVINPKVLPIFYKKIYGNIDKD